MGKCPCIIHSHSTTWHDGCVAILLENGEIYAIAAERVGSREKHSWNSKLAYDHLKSCLPKKLCTEDENNFLINPGADHLDTASHHLNHAAATFFASPFDSAAILIVDGQGPEGGKTTSTTLWVGEGDEIRMIENHYPTKEKFASQSIGHFYTAIGVYAGAHHLYEEGKTMALAAYGKPSRFLEYIKEFVGSNPDGSYYVDGKFTQAILGNTLGPQLYGWSPPTGEIQQIWNKLISLRSSPYRGLDDSITSDDMDIAYAGQVILEEILLGLVRRLKKLTGEKNLCLAGGVFLNCIANAAIVQSKIFDEVYIFPATGDDGQAIGKLFLDIHSRKLPVSTKVKNAYLGPQYSIEETLTAIYSNKEIVIISDNLQRTVEIAARKLAEGELIGWFRGRSEIGPRALGHRSILADPRIEENRDFINGYIKHREWYQPFAAMVPEEKVRDYFLLDSSSPFMLIAAMVKEEKREVIPAVVHIDGSARIQTVNRNQEEVLCDLLHHFSIITGVPILLNTSFNRENEPIVETPTDAIKTFMATRLSALVIENFLLIKK